MTQPKTPHTVVGELHAYGELELGRASDEEIAKLHQQEQQSEDEE